MTNHHLSVEQRFHLEAAFREIDACEDIDTLRSLTKQIITAQENEKAFAREAMVQVRREMEAAASQRFGFNWGQSSWSAHLPISCGSDSNKKMQEITFCMLDKICPYLD